MLAGRLTAPDGRAPSLPSRVEPLESRTLMSASLEQGVLTIMGTGANDQITVGTSSRNLERVAWRGRWRDVERASPRYIEVQVNGKVRRFPAGRVGRIVVDAGAGDDSVSLAGDTDLTDRLGLRRSIQWRLAPVERDAEVHGGDGADHIVGGSRFNRLYGEGGDDRIIGGGLATLDGGDGNDTLGDACGGTGSSTLLGGPDDDLLVGNPDSFYPVDPPGSFRAQFAPASLFGGPGNDQFQAATVEVRDLEPGESVNPVQCHLVG
jgi:Ca2+-binding RTX toxin-like protein